MTTLYEYAYAKLNLTLDVLGKREDGYHDLQSVMQTVSIRDDIEIDVGTGKPWSLKCSREDIPCDESNLAWKAAKVFSEALKIDFDEEEFTSMSRPKPKANVLEYERKKTVEKRTDYGRYERVETREYTEKRKFARRNADGT